MVFAMEQLDRITQHPEIMGGKACIRGMRETVGMIVGQLAAGQDTDAILADYPYLDRENIMQALRAGRFTLSPARPRRKTRARGNPARSSIPCAA